MAVLLSTRRRWSCPNCTVIDETNEARPHTRFHTCAGLRGLTAPLIEDGTRAHVYAVEREDYVGQDTVQTDAEGRPVMSVVTEREDGQDVVVFAPMASARAEEHD